MKKYIFIFLIVLFPASLSALGMSDWSEKTPGGNEINNITGVSLYLNNHQQLDGLWKWYFYKGYVVGQIADPAESDMKVSYFVVNEFNYKITKFASVEDWEAYLKRSDLKPQIWTRWYYGDWTFFNDEAFFFGMYFFIPVIIFIVFFAFLLYKAVKKERFRLFRPYTTIVTILFLLIFCYWLLDLFPQSI